MQYDLFDIAPAVGKREDTLTSTTAVQSRWTITCEQRQTMDLPITGRGVAKANLAAVELLLQLEQTEPAELTTEEADILLGYRGWGWTPELFMEQPPSGWETLAQEALSSIVGLVGEEGYQQARRAILTAYYTPPRLVEQIYRLLADLLGENEPQQQTKPLRVLEPGCGSGLFIGLAPARWPLEWTAVEPDLISSRVVQRLYPQVRLHNRLIEQMRLPQEDCDLVLGNVPFMQEVPHDGNYRSWEFGGLHDYCIARAAAALRPGGVALLLTSIGSLQSTRSQGFRERLSQQVRLLGALKLPMHSVQSYSGTQIGMDLLVLQKLVPGEAGNGKEWCNLVEAGEEWVHPETGSRMRINRWFKEHPESVIGEWCWDKHYGSPRMTTLLSAGEQLDLDLETALARMIPEPERAEAQERFWASRRAVQAAASADSSQGQRDRRQRAAAERDPIELPGDLEHDPLGLVQPNAYLLWEGVPYQYCNYRLHPLSKGSSDRRRRIIQMIQIKQILRKVLELQRQGCSDILLRQGQHRLNQRYDLFVRDYGWLHSRANLTAFGDDPDFPLLLSLEVWDSSRPRNTTKAAIFTQRTIYLEPPRDQPASAKEALIESLADQGRVDLEFMSRRYGRSQAEVIAELTAGAGDNTQPLIFLDPEAEGEWLTAEAYLCGNVKQKLQIAISKAEQNPTLYQTNVQALQAVQPPELLPNQIYVQMGSAWLPKQTVAQFVAHMLGVDAEKVAVRHNRVSNQWDLNTAVQPPTAANVTRWGTSRITGLRLIELALNQQAPVIYDSVWNSARWDYDQVRNPEETRRALNRSIEIKQAFKRWVWTDAERTYDLTRTYNEQFNSTRPRAYDGRHLCYNLSGMSKLWQERLIDPAYHYQLDLIWRIVVEGNTLGQIPVGGGKTAIMVVASQMLRLFKKATKPMIVVPDHLVLQQAGEALTINPGLRVLLIASELMPTPTKRREMINRAATGNWDLIICSQTAFASIPMHPDTVARFQEEEYSLLMDGWHENYSGNIASRRGLKDEERAEARMRAKVEARQARMRRTSVAYFDHMGVDWLFVDESHDFLGLPTDTRITGVLGLGSSSSIRAQDLRYKSRFLSNLLGERKGLVLMSGTPIRNTLGQAWANLVYLMPQDLDRLGLLSFDSFISVFAEAITQTEVTAAGTLDIKTRLATWSNLPEFRNLWRQVAHVIREDQLLIKRPRPIYKTVEVPATPGQLRFFHWLAERVKLIKRKRGKPQPGEDNWCAVCSDTTEGVIDLRLLPHSKLSRFMALEEVATLEQQPTKVEQCIADTYASWADPLHRQKCLVQLIFCDTGSPNRKGRWSVYRHIKQQLVERGVPEAEIAFIHDATSDQAKAELFEQVRRGQVRVLIASTAKLGVGTQIPDRLFQLRHLDCPKRPTDIWQRNGRIIRPGNLNPEVEIYFYVTTGQPIQTTGPDGKNTQVQGISPDSWLYEMVRRKAGFIELGIVNDDSNLRTIEDIDEVTLDFATLMATATGDRRLIEKMNLDRQVQALLDQESDFQVQRSIAQRQVNMLPGMIFSLKQDLDLMQQDLTLAQALQENPPPLRWQQGRKNIDVLTQPKAAAKRLWTWILEARESQKISEDSLLGYWGEFKIWGRQGWRVFLVLHRPGSRVRYGMETKGSAQGNYKLLLNLDATIEQRIGSTQQQILSAGEELEASRAALNVPFERAEELETLLQKQKSLAEALGLLETELAG